MRRCLLHNLWNLYFCDHVYALVCDFIMERKLEQRANMKLCVELGNSIIETLNMLQKSYGSDSIGCAQFFKWYGRFKGRRISLKYDKWFGRLAMSITLEIRIKFISLCMRSVGGQSTTLLMLVAHHIGLCRQSWNLSWTWSISLPSFSPPTDHWIESISHWSLSRPPSVCHWWLIFHANESSPVMRVGSTGMTLRRSNNCHNRRALHLQDQEGTAEELQLNQQQIPQFFWHSWYCALRIHHPLRSRARLSCRSSTVQFLSVSRRTLSKSD